MVILLPTVKSQLELLIPKHCVSLVYFRKSFNALLKTRPPRDYKSEIHLQKQPTNTTSRLE
jgi:hypothetical protein